MSGEEQNETHNHVLYAKHFKTLILQNHSDIPLSNITVIIKSYL